MHVSYHVSRSWFVFEFGCCRWVVVLSLFFIFQVQSVGLSTSTWHVCVQVCATSASQTEFEGCIALSGFCETLTTFAVVQTTSAEVVTLSTPVDGTGAAERTVSFTSTPARVGGFECRDAWMGGGYRCGRALRAC